MENENGTFWEHLEVLRGTLIRTIIVVLVASIIVFLFKDFVFNNIIFAATKNDFLTYKIFNKINAALGLESRINIQLAAQLFIHMSVSFFIGLIISVPYITGEIWHFIKPALYKNEEKIALKSTIFMGILFYLGVLTSFFVIFPLSVNFLAAYKVTSEVDNLIDLDSYTNTFISLSLSMGAVFEFPAAAYFLAKIGILKSSFMKKYRRHAFVVILIAAAIITPTTDMFTMFLVAAPLQMLYEISTKIVKRVESEN